MTTTDELSNGRKAWKAAKACGLTDTRTVSMLALYYIITPIGAAADGASWLLLLLVFSGGQLSETSRLRHYLELALAPFGLTADAKTLLVLTFCLFSFRAALTFFINALDGWLQSQVRRKIQVGGFSRLLEGRWEGMRLGNVGQWTGALTEEASLFSKYLMSVLRSVFSLLTLLILGAMTYALAPQMTLMLAAIAVPSWLGLKGLYSLQTRFSMTLAVERQAFASDINERLAGLFQIKAANETQAYLRTGLRRQVEYTAQEIRLGYLNALIMAFNPTLLSLILGSYCAWVIWSGQPVVAQAQAMGSVGILGFRSLSQLNNLISLVGNLTRLSGSVQPLYALMEIPPEPLKEHVPEPLVEIRLEDVAYAFGERVVLKDHSLSVRPGKAFLLSGSSGAGKTTLANLICGLYEPKEGRVLYVGASGKTYPSTTYRPKIGYVTQDVHLFSGTVRDNLDPGARCSDEDLWKAAALAGAEPFVRRIGGLDAKIAEAGRSLSGGEKRRVAIAAALAQHSDCLILDEVTNGLDLQTKTAILETVRALAEKVLVVAISHDLEAFDRIGTEAYTLKARANPSHPETAA